MSAAEKGREIHDTRTHIAELSFSFGFGLHTPANEQQGGEGSLPLSSAVVLTINASSVLNLHRAAGNPHRSQEVVIFKVATTQQ